MPSRTQGLEEAERESRIGGRVAEGVRMYRGANRRAGRQAE